MSDNRYVLRTPEMWEDGKLIPERHPIKGIDMAFKFYKANCAAQNTNQDKLKVTPDDIKLVENFITKTTEGMTHQEMQAIVKMVYHIFTHAH